MKAPFKASPYGDVVIPWPIGVLIGFSTVRWQDWWRPPSHQTLRLLLMSPWLTSPTKIVFDRPSVQSEKPSAVV